MALFVELGTLSCGLDVVDNLQREARQVETSRIGGAVSMTGCIVRQPLVPCKAWGSRLLAKKRGDRGTQGEARRVMRVTESEVEGREQGGHLMAKGLHLCPPLLLGHRLLHGENLGRRG